MKMGSFFYQENNHGIMGKNDEERGGGSNSSSSSDLSSGSGSGSDSDLFEEVNSSSSSLSSSGSSSPPFTTPTRSKDALHDMSSLLQELPIKRGLSKHYNGRSQSFTSLSNVRSLEDLAKPEHPYNKKLKTCKSYQAFYEKKNNNHESNDDDHHLQTAATRRRSSTTSTKLIKKASLCTKRNNGRFNIGINRPPLIPPLPPVPHKSDTSRNTSFNSQTPLFALGV